MVPKNKAMGTIRHIRGTMRHTAGNIRGEEGNIHRAPGITCLLSGTMDGDHGGTCDLDAVKRGCFSHIRTQSGNLSIRETPGQVLGGNVPS